MFKLVMNLEVIERCRLGAEELYSRSAAKVGECPLLNQVCLLSSFDGKQGCLAPSKLNFQPTTMNLPTND